jgi:alcohol dehydrogenase
VQPLTGEYNFTRLETVVYGPDKLGTLSHHLKRCGASRVMVVTTKTLGRSKLLERVKAVIGEMLAGVFSETAQHAQSRTIDALIEEARRVKADAFVSFGGGTPIDSAKVAAIVLLGGRMPRGMELYAQATGDGRDFLHIAIPTTLSAAEFTPFAGATDEKAREKHGVGDPRLQPRVVILDPTVTTETPAWLWVGTAIRALDHAVEGAYSRRQNPVSNALAARAIALLVAHLKPSLSTTGEDEMYHRGQCQIAAWLSIFGGTNTRFGISHALGHQIGPMWDVPHGFTSCITLPHVMRFMADIAPERFGPIAEGFGVRFDADNPRPGALECAERAARFIAGFEVPTRLRDVGVPEGELARIANTVLGEIRVAQTVDREVKHEELLALLKAAY